MKGRMVGLFVDFGAVVLLGTAWVIKKYRDSQVVDLNSKNKLNNSK